MCLCRSFEMDGVSIDFNNQEYAVFYQNKIRLNSPISSSPS
ncbi:hypothetical protein DVDV_3337 [Desulfovibrio sp. DV]|nr:hypothetical protein DVDV_3337 [Desulfovibrio sp. DV]